ELDRCDGRIALVGDLAPAVAEARVQEPPDRAGEPPDCLAELRRVAAAALAACGEAFAEPRERLPLRRRERAERRPRAVHERRVVSSAIQRAMNQSIPRGRCGPCTSSALTGWNAIVRARSNRRTSAYVRFSARRNAISRGPP